MTLRGTAASSTSRPQRRLVRLPRTLLGAALVLAAGALAAQQESVVATMHNLSVSGPGEIKAISETEVCKFCHVPHNAVVPVPLWGHALSTAQYDTPEIRTAQGARELAPQPDGSSRLCLSCHDGTVALGDVAGEGRPIAMAGTERLTAGQRGFIGTDLTGSHPVSFVVPDGDPEEANTDRDTLLRPLSAVTSDPEVRLDGRGKMQCTTCHDAHSDRYFEEGKVPHFWVKPSVNEVCLTCHAFR